MYINTQRVHWDLRNSYFFNLMWGCACCVELKPLLHSVASFFFAPFLLFSTLLLCGISYRTIISPNLICITSDESLSAIEGRNREDYNHLRSRERATMQGSNHHAHRQRIGLHEHQSRGLYWVCQRSEYNSKRGENRSETRQPSD